MSTKKCRGCGWIYPKEWPGRTCRFCGTKFTDGMCNRCHQYYESTHKDGYCRACLAAIAREWSKKRTNKADTQYKDWLKAIAKIPTPYRTLTEDDWLEACKHFGGCAYCGTDSIEARSMFIPFEEGGRYCKWNIVPACERCETAVKLTRNPFARMDNTLNRDKDSSARKYGYTLENLQRIVDYLKRYFNVEEV